MFEISHSVAPLIFLRSIGVGYLLGALFAVFNCLFHKCEKNKSLRVIGDTVFFLICAVVSFLFSLDVDYGRIRLYVLLGELAGGLIFYCSPNNAIQRLADRLHFRTTKRKKKLKKCRQTRFNKKRKPKKSRKRESR